MNLRLSVGVRAFQLFCAFVLAGCGGGSGSLRSSDWLLFRGDAALSGYTDTRLPKNPGLLWEYKSDARTSSSPVISNGVTYWSDRRGRIYGVDRDGTQVFDYDFATAVESNPMIHDSLLYIGRIDGVMSAVSLSRKEVLWEYETMGQIMASANIANFGGRPTIVFGSYDNYLYCLDSQTGAELNRFESGHYINGAVALWEQYVVFGGCDGWLRVIDCQTGVATDSLQADSYIPASPAVMDGDCYAGDHDGNIYELRLEKGKIIRHRIIMETTADGAFVSVPALSSGFLYVLANDQHLYAINRKDGSVQWKYLLKGGAGESSPVVCRDRVIVCTKSGVVSILDARTGTLLWEYDTGEQIVASPAVVNGRFYVLSSRGTLFCFGE